MEDGHDPVNGRFLEGHREAMTHGLRSRRKEFLRDELPEEEREVWDATEVPPGTNGLLDVQFRMGHVIQYRLMKWLGSNPKSANPKSLTGLEKLLKSLDVPMNRIQQLFETQARVAMAQAGGERDQAMRDYLAQLTPDQLDDLSRGGEIPALIGPPSSHG